MKKLIFILSLICGISCSECHYDASHFEPTLSLLENVKNVLKNSDTEYNQLYDISYHFPQLAEAIQVLRNNYSLCDIKIYKNKGIAFKFNCSEKSEDGCEYYILSSFNAQGANEFYDQFADFKIDQKKYNPDWVFIKKKGAE